ncbi:MAG: transketolase [Acidimicrobiia bacterium]
MQPVQMTNALSDVANRLRIESIRATTAAGSGHPTSCASAAELAAALFFGEMALDLGDPRNPRADRFVLSKGHAAPLLYAVWAELGVVSQDDLLTLRRGDSIYEGHPTPRIPFVDTATGSLGQGLSFGLGMAIAQADDGWGARTFVLMGDGESAEGSVWEAVELAGRRSQANLTAVVDVNRLGQSAPTMYGHDVDDLAARYRANEWHTQVVDGHDVAAVLDALEIARGISDKPTVLVALTYKGRNIVDVEDEEGWHGKPLPPEHAERAIVHLEGLMTGEPAPAPRRAEAGALPARAHMKLSGLSYDAGASVATRSAYGDALKAIGLEHDCIVAVDGDTQNSTYAERFGDAAPDRYTEAYIAEQNMVGIASGQASLGRVPFAATFACFLTRAADQIRMCGISGTNVKLCGSHAGISIGQDGPSQMGLEDLALFGTVPGCVVFYPSDAVSAARAVELAANHEGMCYIRTTRPATEVLYSMDEPFEIGRAKVVRAGDADVCTVVASGVTLEEALAAAETLAGEGIGVRVVDPFTIKPIDAECLRDAVAATGGRVVTVEDHYRTGGIGDAVDQVLGEVPGVVHRRLAVEGVPHSGQPAELLDEFGISARHVAAAVRDLAG